MGAHQIRSRYASLKILVSHYFVVYSNSFILKITSKHFFRYCLVMVFFLFSVISRPWSLSWFFVNSLTFLMV